jgi:peptidylprolyl isomerase
MRNIAVPLLFSASVVGSVACHRDDAKEAHAEKPPVPVLTHIQQVPPPLDLAKPPADAIRTASGLAYKTLVKSEAGSQPRLEDTVMVRYTAWLRNGETFFTTNVRGQPIAIKLSHAAPAFSEALPLLHKGETAMVWAPPSRGLPDGVVYQVEIADIAPPPKVASGAPAASHAQVLAPAVAGGKAR